MLVLGAVQSREFLLSNWHTETLTLTAHWLGALLASAATLSFISAACSSNSVGKALKLVVGENAEQTATFTLMFDTLFVRFFDCLNVRSFTAGRDSHDEL